MQCLQDHITIQTRNYEKNTRTIDNCYLLGHINLRFNFWEIMSVNKRETLQEFEYRLKCEAKSLSLDFKDVKPVKYLLK